MMSSHHWSVSVIALLLSAVALAHATIITTGEIDIGTPTVTKIASIPLGLPLADNTMGYGQGDLYFSLQNGTTLVGVNLTTQRVFLRLAAIPYTEQVVQWFTVVLRPSQPSSELLMMVGTAKSYPGHPQTISTYTFSSQRDFDEENNNIIHPSLHWMKNVSHTRLKPRTPYRQPTYRIVQGKIYYGAYSGQLWSLDLETGDVALFRSLARWQGAGLFTFTVHDATKVLISNLQTSIYTMVDLASNTTVWALPNLTNPTYLGQDSRYFYIERSIPHRCILVFNQSSKQRVFPSQGKGNHTEEVCGYSSVGLDGMVAPIFDPQGSSLSFLSGSRRTGNAFLHKNHLKSGAANNDTTKKLGRYDIPQSPGVSPNIPPIAGGGAEGEQLVCWDVRGFKVVTYPGATTVLNVTIKTTTGWPPYPVSVYPLRRFGGDRTSNHGGGGRGMGPDFALGHWYRKVEVRSMTTGKLLLHHDLAFPNQGFVAGTLPEAHVLPALRQFVVVNNATLDVFQY